VTETAAAFALLVGSVVDATTTSAPYTPQPPRTPCAVTFDGIGTPPVASDLIWARTYANGGFVLAFEAGDVAVDDATPSGPSPKHLTGAFDIHFTLSAPGYADRSSVYACNHDALPIVPAPYALQPQPAAVQGNVTVSGTPAAGVTVEITAASPAPGTLPPATTTDANGTYAIDAVPAAQTVTLRAVSGAHVGMQTVPLAYPDPVTTVNFEL
jgi:hypothetical protein